MKLWHLLRDTHWVRGTNRSCNSLRPKRWAETMGVMSAWPQMVPGYFTLTLLWGFFFSLSIFCLCSLFTWTVCFSEARGLGGELSDSKKKRKRFLCCEGFFVLVEKSPLHLLCVQHAESTERTHWKLIKMHRFTQQFIITLPPPRPLGLEVTAACDKRPHSFINICLVFSPLFFHPAFWNPPKSALMFLWLQTLRYRFSPGGASLQ